MNNEPIEITEARNLLEAFEKSEALSKRHFFEQALSSLQEYIAESPDSKFTKRASNLIGVYTKRLITKLVTTPYSNLDEWTIAFIWAVKYSKEIEEVLVENPDLKDVYNKFTTQQPWLYELSKVFDKLNDKPPQKDKTTTNESSDR